MLNNLTEVPVEYELSPFGFSNKIKVRNFLLLLDACFLKMIVCLAISRRGRCLSGKAVVAYFNFIVGIRSTYILSFSDLTCCILQYLVFQLSWYNNHRRAMYLNVTRKKKNEAVYLNGITEILR